MVKQTKVKTKVHVFKAKANEVRTEIKKYYKGEDTFINIAMASYFARLKILMKSSHGKAKTRLAEVLSRISGKSFSRIQCSQGLTSDRFNARLDVGALIKGEEKIIWKDFTDAYTKFVDELNRAHPTTLNDFFSMMAEEEAIYGDVRKKLKPFVFIATMNPSDDGTYELPKPLVDRFDVSLLMPSANINEKIEIIKMSEAKTNGVATFSLDSIKPMFKENELEEVYEAIDNIKIPFEMKVLIVNAVRELQICKHGEKEDLTNFPQCCTACQYNTQPCAKVISPLSERAELSLLKLVKAYHYVTGAKLEPKLIYDLLPYVISHRINMAPDLLQTANSKTKAIKKVIATIKQKENKERKAIYEEMKKIFTTGSGNLDLFRKQSKNDLIVDEWYTSIKAKMADMGKTITDTSSTKKTP